MNSKYTGQPPGPWTAEWSKEFEEWVVLDAEGKLICWANGENPKPILMTDAPGLAARVVALEAAIRLQLEAWKQIDDIADTEIAHQAREALKQALEAEDGTTN